MTEAAGICRVGHGIAKDRETIAMRGWGFWSRGRASGNEARNG